MRKMQNKTQKSIFISLLILLGVVVGIIFLAPKKQTEQTISKVTPSGYKAQLPHNYLEKIVIKMGEYDFGIRPLSAQAVTKAENEDKISYFDAYQFVDVVYTTSSNKLKEDIILKKPGHPMEFLYELDLANFTYQFDKSKNLVLYPKGEKSHNLNKIFTIEAPYVLDAAGKKTLPGEVEMNINESGQLQIILDQEWFETAVYPVILDPTIEIHILNLYSHPKQGEDWVVDFTTQGQADLKIIPADQATITDDEFVSLSCNGQTVLPQILPDDVIIYPNWQCSGTGQVVHFTKKAGKHTLRFEFGDQVAFAYNDGLVEIFSINFDDGNLDEFNSLDGYEKFASLSVTTEQAQSGDYSMVYEVFENTEGTNMFGVKEFNSTDNLFLDSYVFIPDSRITNLAHEGESDILVSLNGNVDIGISRRDTIDTLTISGNCISPQNISFDNFNNWVKITIDFNIYPGNISIGINGITVNTQQASQFNCGSVGLVKIGHISNYSYIPGSKIYFDNITGSVEDEEPPPEEDKPTLDVQGVYNFQGQVNISAE